MEYLLADVTWENIILVGTAMGIFTGGKVIHTKLTSKSNGKYNPQLCNEKHKVIDERHVQMNKSFDKVFEKLDKITDHLMKP